MLCNISRMVPKSSRYLYVQGCVATDPTCVTQSAAPIHHFQRVYQLSLSVLIRCTTSHVTFPRFLISYKSGISLDRVPPMLSFPPHVVPSQPSLQRLSVGFRCIGHTPSSGAGRGPIRTCAKYKPSLANASIACNRSA